ncbi:hypothetical protein M2151_001150 [Lachnospiraceae bacterium PH1-22]
MFKKKEVKAKEAKVKEPKVKVRKVGKKRYSLIVMWVLLIGSIVFGIYNNFRAVDTHTVHEKEVIKEKVTDNSAVESFVKRFAKEYFSWELKKESMEERQEAVNLYLAEDLHNLANEVVRSDIPNSSQVTDVMIDSVVSASDESRVTFTVYMDIKEDKSTSKAIETYFVKVYHGEAGALLLTTLPTLDSVAEYADYQPTRLVADGTVKSNEIKDITEFLETFFEAYPKTNAKELAYYVKKEVLKPIEKEYVLSEIKNPLMAKEGDNYRVQVSVEYLNPATNMLNVSQYDLVLEKGETWTIIDVK